VLWLFEGIEEILVSCTLADEVDILLVMKAAIKFGDIGVIKKGMDFNLISGIFFNFHLNHLVLFQYFQSA
jgi:hypothetical protein